MTAPSSQPVTAASTSPAPDSVVRGRLGLSRVVELVTALDLPAAHFAVFGSAPMLVAGLRADVSDVDLLARGPAWRQLTAQASVTSTESGCGLRVPLFGGAVEAFDRWPGMDTDALIDAADLAYGLRWVQLGAVLAFKRRAGRVKDRADVAALLAVTS